ncbi:M17 family peptidase N-terminal domain-containing protein [Microbacterium sp. B19]|uniref:M17 family peptidase N-terminal domain-containing protein n=1 Tax=Microbacterium sp. B19 TaxID=96765 RepID=UPI00034AD113|nr:M17 family peptidase N-terminal domain-containing protein [Microbacterium sp. B19]
MPYPSVTHTDVPVLESGADAILLVVPKANGSATDPEGWDGLSASLTSVGFTGGPGSFQRVHVPGVTVPVAVVGAGSDPGAAAVRDAVGTALRQLTGFEHVAVQSLVDVPWASLAEGAALGGYRFAGY